MGINSRPMIRKVANELALLMPPFVVGPELRLAVIMSKAFEN